MKENHMKVKVLQQITGTRDGKRWPPVGETMELPPAEAEAYVAQRFVEAVAEQKKPSKKAD